MFRYFIVVFQFVQIAIELNGNLKYIEDKRQIFYWLESFFICVASDSICQPLQRSFLLLFLLVVVNRLLYFMADVIAHLFVLNRSHTQS